VELTTPSGAMLVQDSEMVASLLAMKAAMDDVMAEAFQRDENFGNTLKEAFEQFINQRQNKCAQPHSCMHLSWACSCLIQCFLAWLEFALTAALCVRRPAELIAKFIDSELRAGKKGQTEEELETTLDKALILFRYISVSLHTAPTQVIAKGSPVRLDIAPRQELGCTCATVLAARLYPLQFLCPRARTCLRPFTRRTWPSGCCLGAPPPTMPRRSDQSQHLHHRLACRALGKSPAWCVTVSEDPAARV
jgi:Cullin family